mmetsp:Transcript_18767/g.63388  ORF Transcript_18767/g.63388 Transcript_18767/m.63388 type:complete len:262 (-) Transcript_18767:273-1058(-)
MPRASTLKPASSSSEASPCAMTMAARQSNDSLGFVSHMSSPGSARDMRGRLSWSWSEPSSSPPEDLKRGERRPSPLPSAPPSYEPPPRSARSRYVSMASASVPFSRSTSTTRTLTAWPSESTLARSSVRSSATREMWTRPSTPSATVTKAPQDWTLETTPSMNADASAPTYALSASILAALPPPARGDRAERPPCGALAAAEPSGFMDSDSCFFDSSHDMTRTETASPTETMEATSVMNLSESSLMCTRPSETAPMSTKAP